VPHAEFHTLAAKIYLAASQTPTPKNNKNKKNPSATPEPSDPPLDSDEATSDPFSTILEFLLNNLWLPAIVVGLVGINIGWRKLTERQNLNGQPLSPLGDIIRRTLRLMFKEDKTPVFMRPQKFAMKMRWLTWQRYWFIAGLAVIFDITAFSGIIPDEWEIFFTALIGIFILGGIQHIRLIFQRRHRILMQMFEVASAECKYPKGSELNPWGWVQITKWSGLYSPAGTYVVFPPRVRSEDERFRQAFEINFNGTVSSEHTWMYTWESANNRVLCEPVPFITDQAPYPFPDEHPWNEFPLGIAAGGQEAIWDVSTFPHSLVAGTTGAGKAKYINTPIPVPVSERNPAGWTTFGDVEVGDTVFDEHGQMTRVTGVSEIRDEFDMYRVSFSDGTFIDASGDHMWFTHTRRTRESGWNARRKDVERRSLVSDAGRAALQDLLAAQTDSSEVTIRQVAEAAGVHETSPWLLEVAASLGHVGEVQAVVDFHYAEQQVLQRQKMAVYDAQAAWGALARYRDNAKVPAWYAARGECAALAAAATDTDTITSRDIGQVLGMKPKMAGAMLRQKGVESWVAKAGPGRAVAVFPARTTWTILAESQPVGDDSPWKRQRTLFEQRLAASQPGDEVTASDIAASVGVSATDVRGVLKRLGVACAVEKREVLLQVPQKVVRRKTVPARTYLGQEFIRAVLERVETPAHDQRHKRDYGAVRTTLNILETLTTSSGAANHSIPVAGPLELPDAELPIGPYLLGVWLGDGFSRSGAYAGIDHEMADFLRADGEEVTESRKSSHDKSGLHQDFREWKVAGLTQSLRDAGLLQRTTEEGSRKHIPAIYLRSSIAQRQALLAGLLDTDGTVAPQGTVHFDNTNKELAYQTLELARSLGYRATITEKRATLNGEDYGLVYRVAFTCGESPFRLSRKTATFLERTSNHNPEKTSRRYIIDIQRIPAVPARCIMVDSPSRLFLAGDAMIPTHNSVTQRTILLHALQSPDWRVSLIDPKRVELSAYTSHRNVVKVATELEESVALLEGVEQEMQSRYKRMEKEGVNHFKRLSTPPPAMLLMVDELFALLSPENIRSDEGKERDEMHARATVVIGSIARLGRAAGIHMILATQRPDAKVLPGETKANLDCRIAQGRMDTTPSLMVLDSEAATRIPKIKGRAIVRQGGDLTEFQAYFLPEDSLAMVLEMSEALASEQMSVQDFKDLIEQARAGDEGKSRGKLRFPKIPVPRGLAIRFSDWLERRKRAVEENEAEGKRFASKKSKTSPPVADSPSATSGRKGFRRRREAPEGAEARIETPETPLKAREGRMSRERADGPQDGREGDFEAPGRLDRARAAGDFMGEVRHEGALDGGVSDEESIFMGDDIEEEDFLPPRQANSREVDRPSWPANGVGDFVDEAEDEDDDIELIFEEDEDFLPPLDLDTDDFLDDIVPAGSRPSTPVKPLLPKIPRVEDLDDTSSTGYSADLSTAEAVDSAVGEDFAGATGQGATADSHSALADDIDSQNFLAEDGDVFGSVAEAPWMPDTVPGSVTGPSPFGGGDVSAPSSTPPSPASTGPPTDSMVGQNIDDDDEPFI